MTKNELRESMWELCYDLLPAGEREALIVRIKSDPQAARLYAEVRLQADLVAAASVVEDDALVISPPVDLPGNELHSAPEYVSAAGAARPAAPVERPRKRDVEKLPATRASRSSGQALHWILALAALVLVGVMGYGAIRPLQSQHALADRFVVTEIEAPARMQAGLSNKVVLKSRSVLGKSVEAQVDVKVLAPEGTVLFHEGVPTGEHGEATVEIPGTALVSGARLVAAGRSRRMAQEGFDSSRSTMPGGSSPHTVAVELPIQAEAPLTYFWLESPLAADDQPVRYAAVNLDRFSLRPVPSTPAAATQSTRGDSDLQFGANDAASARATADSRGLARSNEPLDAYLVEGEVRLPTGAGDRASRLDSLAMREQLLRRSAAPDDSGRDSADPLVRSFGFPAADTPRLPTPSIGSGDVAAPPRGEAQRPPADPRTEVEQLSSAKKQGLPGNSPGELAAAGSAPALAAAAGGATAPASGPDSPDSLAEVNSPAGETGPFALRSLPIVAAGEPVTVELAEPIAGRKLLLQAINRDVVVAARKLDESPVEAEQHASAAKFRQRESAAVHKDVAEARQYTLSLPPEADGQVQVEVLDLERSPPQVVESYFYYRQPARELQIDFVSPRDVQARFAPGDWVQMRLRVQNEHGEASPAALGVRVWNESVIQETGEPVLLADHVRRSQKDVGALLTTAAPLLEKRSEVQDEALAGVDDAQQGQAAGPAAGQAEMLEKRWGAAAMAAMSRFDDGGLATAWDYETPPVRSSNKSEVSGEYQSQQSALEAKWRGWREIVGRILVIAGGVLMLGLAVQFWVRMPTQVFSATLAMTAAAASLVVGAIWMGHSPPGYEVAAGYSVDSLAIENRPAPAAAPLARAPASSATETTFAEVRPTDDGFARPKTEERAPPPLAGEASSAPRELGVESAADFAAAPSFGRDKSLPAPAADGAEPDELPPPSPPETESLFRSRPARAGLAKSASAAPQPGSLAPDAPREPASDLPADRAGNRKASRGAAQAAPAGPGAPAGGAAAVRLRSDPAPLALPATSAPPQPAEITPLAAAPGEVPPPAAATEEKETPASVLAGTAGKQIVGEGRGSAPASLYFNPRLATDEQGFATITFQMPLAEADYRILVDAIGGGRIGSRELRIQCRLEPPPAEAGEAAEK